MATRIETRLTKLIGTDLPIIQAGMSWASSNVALPLAVSRAGALGVIGSGPMRPDELAAAIDAVRAGTDRPFAVNVPLYRKGADDILGIAAERRVPILIASQGGPRKYVDRFKSIGTICLHVVAGEEHARKAVEAGVDGLIVVGGEAGGHPPPELVSTLVIGRAVVRAVPDTPIVLSGGLADGSGLAAALALGADGVQMGTRFMLTPEANIHPAYREELVKAGVADTAVVGRGFGVVRVLRNPFAQAMLDAEGTAQPEGLRREMFQKATLKLAAFDGDVGAGKIEAGQSVGLCADVVPAAEVVRRTVEEYAAAVRRLPGVGTTSES
jgi:enoyl-[acyl-carrier protein] reductase II